MNKNDKEKLAGSFIKFYEVISTLRGPDGCAWDKKQTADTLRSNLIEEAFECIDAIQENDDENLREELGDLLLVILMISKIKEQEDSFHINTVLQEITEKLIRRHPHVFGDEKDKSVSNILKNWEHIKQNVEGKYKEEHFLDNVPKNLPPLERSNIIQKYAGKVGFDWKEPFPVVDKIKEELEELISELKPNNDEKIDKKKVEMEIGDLLFTVINLSRIMKIDPGLALNSTNNKFINRFNNMEKELKKQNKSLKESELEEMDNIWNRIKKSEE